MLASDAQTAAPEDSAGRLCWPGTRGTHPVLAPRLPESGCVGGAAERATFQGVEFAGCSSLDFCCSCGPVVMFFKLKVGSEF